MNSANADTISECSEASTLIDGSVISTVPDRHGFLGGTQYSPEPRQGPPPEIILRRERKWLKMLSQWNFYMDRNYRKIKERCRKGNTEILMVWRLVSNNYTLLYLLYRFFHLCQ